MGEKEEERKREKEGDRDKTDIYFDREEEGEERARARGQREANHDKANAVLRHVHDGEVLTDRGGEVDVYRAHALLRHELDVVLGPRSLRLRTVDFERQVVLVEVQLRAADARDLLLRGAPPPQDEGSVLLAN